MQSTRPIFLDSMSRSEVNVKGFTLEVRVLSIFPEPFGRFSFNSTQMFLLVRRCAETTTRLHRLKVNVTLRSHGIDHQYVSAQYRLKPLNDFH